MKPSVLLEGYIGIAILLIVVFVLFEILMIICNWMIFEKAKQPGWAAIIPIYCTIIKLKVAGRPISWVIWLTQSYIFYILYSITREPTTLLLYLFSIIANLVFYILVLNGISKSFGKDAGFTVGLLFLGIIFFPILAFGSSKYIGPGGVPESNENF